MPQNLNTGEWPTEWIKCLVILLLRKGNFVALLKLQNHQPHQKSKQIHVEDYPNQTSEAEKIIAKWQASFGEAKSTKEQI